MKPRQSQIWVPVRKASDDGHEWYDYLSGPSGVLEVAKLNADDQNKRLPSWAKANPVVRYSLCELKEKESVL